MDRQTGIKMRGHSGQICFSLRLWFYSLIHVSKRLPGGNSREEKCSRETCKSGKYPEIWSAHYGPEQKKKQQKKQPSNFSLSHTLGSECTSRANKWLQRSRQAKQAVQTKQCEASSAEQSKQANGQACGPALTSWFLVILDHSAALAEKVGKNKKQKSKYAW